MEVYSDKLREEMEEDIHSAVQKYLTQNNYDLNKNTYKKKYKAYIIQVTEIFNNEWQYYANIIPLRETPGFFQCWSASRKAKKIIKDIGEIIYLSQSIYEYRYQLQQIGIETPKE